MKRTMYEKLLCAKAGCKEIMPGQVVEVSVDRLMIHDFFAPFVIHKFRDMGFSRVFDPDRIVFVYDHLVPAVTADDTRHHADAEAFIREQGITRVHRADGVCHQVMHERGHVLPGDLVLGTDSHTTTYGALGALATGVGYTEMAAVMGTGRIWLKMVPTVRVEVSGQRRPGVYAKDIVLAALRELTAEGASYKALEFGGSAVEALSMDARFTLSNMAVEAGAKVGLVATDEKAQAYLFDHAVPAHLATRTVAPDPGAPYERTVAIDAAALGPLAACPFAVDNVKPVGDLAGLPIDQAFLGSCTNGRLEDMAVAAGIMRGHHVHADVRFIVTPASVKVYQDALAAGYIDTLLASGAVITHPSCGLCAGRSGGVLGKGDRIIASNNRNFRGRMGDPDVETFLASPAVVAASALKGRIALPVEYEG